MSRISFYSGFAKKNRSYYDTTVVQVCQNAYLGRRGDGKTEILLLFIVTVVLELENSELKPISARGACWTRPIT